MIQELGNTNLETVILNTYCKIEDAGDWFPKEPSFEIRLPETLSLLCLKDDPKNRCDEYVPATTLFYAFPQSSMWSNLIALEWITPEDLNFDGDHLLTVPLQ